MNNFKRSVAQSLRKEHVFVPLLICIVWALMVLPNLSVRSFIWEEGTNAENARYILAHGEFIRLTIYGTRWVDRPSMLPALIAGFATLTGGVNEWSSRLPAMISVLVTTLMIQRLVRRYVSLQASLFAASAFFFSPLLLRKLTIAEPDTLITCLSFCAFILWWNGAEAGKVSASRWVAIASLLTAVGLAKGPQPLAFFSLGVGAYLLIHRQFSQSLILAVALVPPIAAIVAWAAVIYQPGDEAKWIGYMRLGGYTGTFASYVFERARFVADLAIEMLPATLLLPFVPPPWQHSRDSATPPILESLSLYACLCILALVFWPGAVARYAMPAVPAVCLMAAIAWDRLRGHVRAQMARLAGSVTGVLALYQLALVLVVMPLYSDRFEQGRSDGRAIDRVIRAEPAPVYCASIDSNQLFYLSQPITCLDAAHRQLLDPPAWLVMNRNTVMEFAAMRPDLTVHVAVTTVSGPALVAAQVSK
jgi:4-amino-4-deoxy-L-arabinose transferase-like glycosyltransferase